MPTLETSTRSAISSGPRNSLSVRIRYSVCPSIREPPARLMFSDCSRVTTSFSVKPRACSSPSWISTVTSRSRPPRTFTAATPGSRSSTGRISSSAIRRASIKLAMLSSSAARASRRIGSRLGS